ncbi:hypothetical protein JW921_04235 [Candidatus Fermentibacterales bacterium]|nr:hypothetical protein [Candidatus Fermentibacterales bacterium]
MMSRKSVLGPLLTAGGLAVVILIVPARSEGAEYTLPDTDQQLCFDTMTVI